MNIIQTIKDGLGAYFLSGKMHALNREKMFVNMEDAKTIGIVFEATDPANFELVKKYMLYLREMKKRIKAIGFYNTKNMLGSSYSKLEYDFFCQKDLNWHNVPDSIYVKNFTEEKFDILLDLNLNDLFPLHYISSLSRARFKVGKKSEKNNFIFDLMIETDVNRDLKYFLKNIDTYLFIINNNRTKQNSK
jgi:hypothetical protein